MIFKVLFEEIAPLADNVQNGLVQPFQVELQPAVAQVLSGQCGHLVVQLVVFVYL